MTSFGEKADAAPALLIFDCDGVLVDSEILVCTAVSEELTRLGYPITPEDVVLRFAGRPEREMLAEVTSDWGRPVPPAYFASMKTRVDHAFANDLRAIACACPGAWPPAARRASWSRVCVMSGYSRSLRQTL